MKETDKFNFTYSSTRREEIEAIRKKYVETKDSKSDLDELRKLDRKISNQAVMAGIICGLCGVLLLGTGLSLVLSFDNFIVGVPIGVIGIAGMSFSVPVNNKTLKELHKKNAKKVLELTDELLEINRTETK